MLTVLFLQLFVFFQDGVGTKAGFFSTMAIVSEGSARLWVSDTSNHALRLITNPFSTANVTTIAGVLGIPGFATGVG